MSPKSLRYCFLCPRIPAPLSSFCPSPCPSRPPPPPPTNMPTRPDREATSFRRDTNVFSTPQLENTAWYYLVPKQTSPTLSFHVKQNNSCILEFIHEVVQDFQCAYRSSFPGMRKDCQPVLSALLARYAALINGAVFPVDNRWQSVDSGWVCMFLQ